MVYKCRNIHTLFINPNSRISLIAWYSTQNFRWSDTKLCQFTQFWHKISIDIYAIFFKAERQNLQTFLFLECTLWLLGCYLKERNVCLFQFGSLHNSVGHAPAPCGRVAQKGHLTLADEDGGRCCSKTVIVSIIVTVIRDKIHKKTDFLSIRRVQLKSILAVKNRGFKGIVHIFFIFGQISYFE